MEITGIICEYNPLHLGHKKQMDLIRRQLGIDSGIVCLMSGNYVQRGSPAIVDKRSRAKAAVACGADLVLEAPVTVSLSSAEGFAAGGVRLLSGFCHRLCFGAETPDAQALNAVAQALLEDAFPRHLRSRLDQGLSFPAARQQALCAMGLDGNLVASPNNILAVEYCKAILAQESPMRPMPILREGSYHAPEADCRDPSATAVRELMLAGKPWQPYVPPQAADCFAHSQLHATAYGQRAILARLRTMTEAEFAALPFGSEGLWRKFMHAARECADLEQMLCAVKSKRYTRTRLDRMLMCAFLGITARDLQQPPPYARVLAFNQKGRQILKAARQAGCFPNIGQEMDHPYQTLEERCGALYGLFAAQTPEPPDLERQYRVYCRD